MSGPKWKEALRSLDNRVDHIRRQADHLDDKDDRLRSVRKAEVYRNANTLVEVAIKTRKESRDSGKKKKEVVKVESNPRARKVIATKLHDGFKKDEESRELRRLRSRLSEMKDALRKLQSDDKTKSKEIEDLRDIVSKLSTNNKAMVNLLSESSELEDEIRETRKMNKELQEKYEREKSKNAQLGLKLADLEKEVEHVRAVLGSFTSSLSKEAAKVLAPNGKSNVSHLPATFDVSEDKSLSTDSALGESEATSKPKNKDLLAKESKKIDEIISSAQKLIVNQAEFRSANQSTSEKAQILRGDDGHQQESYGEQFEKLDLSETVDSVRTAGSDSPKKRTEELAVTLKAKTVNAVDADLKKLLNKLKSNDNNGLNDVSVPEVPSAKSFGQAAPSNIDQTSSNGSKDENDTTTQSNFNAGLEEKLYISHTLNTEFDESLP